MLFLNYLVCLFLPLYLIKLPLFSGASLPLLDIFLLLVILINFWKIDKPITLFKEKIKTHQKEFLALSLVLFGFITSTFLNLQSSNWTNSLGLLKSYFFLPLVFAFSLLLLWEKKLINLSYLLFTLFVSLGFQAFLGYFFILTNRVTFDHRLHLFYNSPNSFAMLMALNILIGLWLWQQTSFHPQKFFRRFLILILIIASLFSLYYTYSLGAWLALFGSLFFIFPSLLFFKKNLSLFFNKFISVRYLKLIFFLSLFFLWLIFLLPLFHLNSPSSSSSYSRLVIYRSAVKIIKTHWLMGIGLSNFQTTYLNQQKFFPAYPQWAVPHGHNLLLHFWLEGGLLSLSGLIWLLFLILFNFSPQKKSSFENLLMLLLLYFIIHGWVDLPVWKNDLAVIFWLTVVFLAFSKKSLSSHY